MYIPMVSCTHNFVRVNIKNDSRILNAEETDDKSVQRMNATTTDTIDGTVNRNNNNVPVAPLKTLVDVYCIRMEPES